MKAAFVPRYGPPEVVELRDVPDPVPGPGQVRVKVLATAVTTGDWRVRSGILPRGFGALRGLALGFGGPRRPVLGTDAAGVVESLGPGVTGFAVGDAVVAFPGATQGAHAELLLMPAAGRIARKPPNLTFEEAAALPFGGMTALDFLGRGDVQADERVLVNGASGNVGSATVQLAKHLGAHVIAVCSAASAELVRSLGADEVIDYAAVDFTAGPARFDVIVDTIGNAPYARVEPVLAPGGRHLAVLADLRATVAAAIWPRRSRHRRLIAGPAAEKPEYLTELLALASRGAFQPVIHQRFPFSELVEAYRVVDSGHKKGAVVVTLDPRATQQS